MKRKSNLRLLFSIMITVSLVTNQFIPSSLGGDALLNIVFDTNLQGSSRPDFGLFVAQYVRDIGIELEVRWDDWHHHYPYYPYPHDITDLGAVKLAFKNREPDFNFLQQIPFWMYRPTSYTFPHQEEFEEMIKIGPTIESEQERIEYYQNLQEFFMDKVLLYWPLIIQKSFESLHNNTFGYDSQWGWIESSPYMAFYGLHEGQVSTDEFIFADANWRELNPLFTDDTNSAFIWDLIAEPLLKIDPNGNPTRNGLISNWIQINSSHYQFFMRPNVYWNPSYNNSGRTASSEPLQNATLMSGLKGEYSSGTNQIVTAKDAVFTLLTWANPTVSEQAFNFEWMIDVYVDPGNPFSFHIHVDGNPDTNETEYYSLLFDKLELSCLPEFYLNSTADTITNTTTGIECKGLYPDIDVSTAWIYFSTSGFGCGKFMLDYYIRNSVTVLQRSPYWFGVGAKDGAIGLQPFMETVKVRVIPDTSAELAEFKAGKLDITDVSSFPHEREQLEIDPLFDVYSTGLYFMHVLVFNVMGDSWDHLNNIWVDVPGYGNCTVSLAVRKAICHAIDRTEMGQVLFDEYSLTDCMLPSQLTDWYYEDIQTKYEYDLIKAFKWMKAAGFDIIVPTPGPISTPTSTPTPNETDPTFITIDYPVIIGVIGLLFTLIYYSFKSRRKR